MRVALWKVKLVLVVGVLLFVAVVCGSSSKSIGVSGKFILVKL